MSKFDMNSLRQEFSKENNKGGNKTFYPFWDMGEDQSVIVRFLPDLNESNPRVFIVEKVFHVLLLNGKKTNVPCLHMYGDECPICKASRDFYNKGDEVNGKQYWRKKQYLTQALIIRDPLPVDSETGKSWVGRVGILPLGFQIYETIKSAFASTDDPLEAAPFEFERGYDFVIKKTKQGKYDSYGNGTKFIMRQRPLGEEEVEVAEEGMIDLSTLLPPNPGHVKVQEMLTAALCGGQYDAEEEFIPIVPKKATEVKSPTANSDDEVRVDDMLATIRARRSANHTQSGC